MCDLDNLQQISKQLKTRLDGITDEEKAELMRLPIHKVWVDGSGSVTIEFAIPPVLLGSISDPQISPHLVIPICACKITLING